MYDPRSNVLDGLDLLCKPYSLDMFPNAKVVIYQDGLRALSRQLLLDKQDHCSLTACSSTLRLPSLINFSIASMPSLTSSTFSLATPVHHVPFSAQGPLSWTSSPSKSPVLKKDALPSVCRATLVPLEDEAVGVTSDARPLCRWG